MCRTLSHDPLALDPNCIHIVDAQVFAGSTYHLVASDDNDFNALLPAWGIREAYMGPGNTLAEASVLCLLCNAVQECWGFVTPLSRKVCPDLPYVSLIQSMQVAAHESSECLHCMHPAGLSSMLDESCHPRRCTDSKKKASSLCIVLTLEDCDWLSLSARHRRLKAGMQRRSSREATRTPTSCKGTMRWRQRLAQILR